MKVFKSGFRGRQWAFALLASSAVLGLAVASSGDAASASQVPAAGSGGASVTITPASTTTPAGAPVTYTVSVSCSVSGGCNATTVSFPSASITGDGSTTDFGPWFGNSSCSGVTKSVSGSTVTYSYGNLPTGTLACTFTVSPPNYVTVNGTTATLTPTVSGTNFGSSSGSSATLTVTASHNITIHKYANVSTIGSGAGFHFELDFQCGAQGSIGTSSVSFVDQLPANFTYTSYAPYSPAPGTFSYDAAAHTFSYSDPTGASCNLYGGVVVGINGTASTSGTPDAGGDTIKNTMSATATYRDGTPFSQTSNTVAVTVVDLVPKPFLTKAGGSTSFTNYGQYKVNNQAFPNTYPGNWDGTGRTMAYTITASSNGTDTGVTYSLQDPLPCLDNLANSVYTSNAAGSACAHPAFIPTVITPPLGFTPSASDKITLVYADGSTGQVAYQPGVGWTIPTSPAVAEIDVPRFPEEGSNSNSTLSFTVYGYAAASASPNTIMTNTVTGDAYPPGSNTPAVPEETAQGSVIVAGAQNTEVYGVIDASASVSSCMENVSLARSSVEIPTAPSQAIYLDYLAPAGATLTSSLSQTITLRQTQGALSPPVAGGSAYTATVAGTATPDYNGTGRTLYQWVIPAGVITSPGDYAIGMPTLSVSLGMGCNGTYQNDMTAGYGTTITACGQSGTKPPQNPSADSDLRSNGSPIAGNYCGFSAPVTIAAINPAYRVDKSVQGDQDKTPVSSGGVGQVTASGGSATYRVTFTNTGGANLTDPVLYDLLPAAGDTDVTSTSPRGSQFAVTLTSVGPLPGGVTVYYSQATNPCRPEVLATNPGCVNDWSTTPPAPLSGTTALKIVYNGVVPVPGGSGSNTFTVPFTVSTPSINNGEIAWNTVGSTAMAGGTYMAPAESSPTGLTAPVGTPVINPMVGGIAAASVLAVGGALALARRRRRGLG